MATTIENRYNTDMTYTITQLEVIGYIDRELADKLNRSGVKYIKLGTLEDGTRTCEYLRQHRDGGFYQLGTHKVSSEASNKEVICGCA